MTAETVSDGDGSVPISKTREIVPDSLLRPANVQSFENMSVSNATRRSTSYTYFAQHSIDTITSPGGIKTQFTYDTRGRLLTSWPAAQNAPTIFSEFDSWGNACAAVYPDGTEERFVFNSRGDLVSFKDRQEREVKYEYNLRRQRTKTIRVLP